MGDEQQRHEDERQQDAEQRAEMEQFVAEMICNVSAASALRGEALQRISELEEELASTHERWRADSTEMRATIQDLEEKRASENEAWRVQLEGTVVKTKNFGELSESLKEQLEKERKEN